MERVRLDCKKKSEIRYGFNHFRKYKVSYQQERDSLVAQMVKSLPAMWETQVPSLGWEDSPGEGKGNPLQYFCLENPMDRGAWQAIIHRVEKRWTRLSDFTFTFILTSYSKLRSKNKYTNFIFIYITHATSSTQN